ncbi:hypothetical protein ACE6H2_022405 [Prunus campanulata]
MVLTFSALQVESEHEYYCDFNGRVASKVHIYEAKLLNFQDFFFPGSNCLPVLQLNAIDLYQMKL